MSTPEPTPDYNKSDDPIDTGLVRRLADILKDTDLTEIEVERGDLKIRVARKNPAAGPLVEAVAAQPPPLAHAPTATVAAVPADAAPAGEVVKSPMVGTAYLQPQPGAPPFVRVGDRVSEGQTLLVVEAMKTMNPIAAPRAGVVAEVLIADAQPIEYDEPLVVIA